MRLGPHARGAATARPSDEPRSAGVVLGGLRQALGCGWTPDGVRPQARPLCELPTVSPLLSLCPRVLLSRCPRRSDPDTSPLRALGQWSCAYWSSLSTSALGLPGAGARMAAGVSGRADTGEVRGRMGPPGRDSSSTVRGVRPQQAPAAAAAPLSLPGPCWGCAAPGRAAGTGLSRGRGSSWPAGPQGGRWVPAPHGSPRGPTLLISCERERESWREIFLSANLITIKIPIKSSYP